MSNKLATNTDSTLLQAQFNPLVKPYMVLQVAFILCMTIFGIPLALIWVLGVGQ